MSKNFREDKSGNVVPTFAVVSLMLLGIVGSAVDYTNAARQDSAIQNALDAAVLAGALETDEASAKQTVVEFFESEFPQYKSPKVSFQKSNTKLIVTAVQKTEVENTFMKVLGNPTTQLENIAEATAPRMLSEIRFQPIKAGGWWDKKVTLMVKSKGATDAVPVVEVEYKSKVNHKSTSFEASPPGWTSLGEFEEAYLLFEINPESRGFFKGVLPHTIRSDDSKYSDRLYVDGERYKKGIAVDIFKVLPCGESIQEWEDGGGHKPDIKFRVDTKCENVNPATVHLTK